MVLVKFLGTLYLDGKPANPGAPRSGEQISIGDTVAGKEIPFLPWGKGLVATLPLCNNISWNELNEMGFATGDRKPLPGRQDVTLPEASNQSISCRMMRSAPSSGFVPSWNRLSRCRSTAGTLEKKFGSLARAAPSPAF